MVCDRCITIVKGIFEENSHSPNTVLLGEVQLAGKIDKIDLNQIEKELKNHGFELIDQSSPILVLKIKAALTSLYNGNEISEDFKLSSYLAEQLPYDYSHMSRVFSHHEGDTIEHFVIKLRIEKAKELLTYNDFNVSEIAYKLGYVSAAHFSRQFKKIVGESPSEYRKNPSLRKSLGEL